MIVKPAPGLKVRHPVTKQLLPDEGIVVPDGDIFWTRVLNDGDLVEVSAKEFQAAQERAEADAEAVREAQAKAAADANAASSDQPAANAAATDEEVEKQ
ncbi:hypothetical protein AWB77_04784 [Caballeronia fortuita]|uniref:DUF2635 domain-containing protein n=1 Tax=Caballeronia fortuita TaxID=1777138 RepID=A0A158D2I8_9BURK|nr:DUF2635 domain-containing protein [Caballeronia fortuita]SAK88446.1 hypothetical protein AWB77_04784 [Caballeronia fortuita]